MAKNLQFQINYTGQGYLDSKTSVASISELAQKWDFEGQSVSMPTAFFGKNDIPYPIDFWLTPYGEIDKWEIKTMPSIETEEDLENFKRFVEDFKAELKYYPLADGFEFLVDGEKYVFGVSESGEATYTQVQASIDELIADTVENAVEEVTSGASEAFDTLKEIEDWINANSGKTVDLTGYATEAWVKEQNYLTEHQDISSKQDKIEDLETIREGAAKGATALQSVPEGYATKDYVDGKVGEIVIPTLDGYATESWVNEQGFLTEHQDLSGYATEAWVGEQGFLTEHQDISGLATKEEVTEAIASIEIPTLDGYATETWVSAEIAKAQLEGGNVDLSGYATKDDIKGLASEQFVAEEIAKIEIPTLDGYATEEWVGEQGFLTEHQSLEGLATEQFVTEKISEIQIPTIDGLATETYVDEKIASINIPSTEGLATEEWVKEQNYLTEHQDITGKQDKIEDLDTIREGASKGATALQEVPEGYATEAWVNEQGFLTEHQDISGLATKEEVANAIAEIEIPTLDGYATEAWVGEQGFLTEHQDISGKQDKIEDLDTIREGASKGATALQEVPEGYATEAWVGEQGFLTEHQDISGLATKEEVANAIAEIEIPTLDGYATETWVGEQGFLTEHQDISGLATKEELANVSGSIKTVIEDLLIPENAKESLDTLEEISAWIQSHPEDAALMNAQIVALQESAHTHENKGVLDGITADKVAAWDAAEANAKGYTDDEIEKLSDVYAKTTDLEGLATETWVSAEIAKAQLEGEDVDLSGYATKDDLNSLATKEETEAVKTWVGEQGFLTEHQDISGLATKEEVANAIAEIEIPTLDGYATEAWVGEQGFLTEHQDISGLATKEEVSEAVLSAQTYADSLVDNLKPYSGGTAVDVTDYTVNVNVAEDGFLEVNDENELTVTGVTLDAAVTSKDITIEGGQWATAVKTVFTGGTVPAGTTWQSFLESMLCVEKFDTSYSMSKAFTVSCGTLGEGITGATNNSSVEVGTKVSLKSFEANPTTASQSYTVSTFDYGYKLGEDGTYNKSTSFKETLTPSLKASNDALTATFTTFVDESGNTIAKISQNTSIPQVNMRVMDGTNKVVIAQTGDTYTSSSAVTAGTIYVATNLKNYYKADKVTPNTYEPKVIPEDKTATASTTYTVTGYRNTFYGTTSKTDAADATFIRTLNKSNKAIAAGNTISFETNSSDGHLRMVIASPRTIKSVKNQTGTQDLTALLVGTKATVSVGGVDNFAPISYNVYDYTWKGAFGNETWIITFA